MPAHRSCPNLLPQLTATSASLGASGLPALPPTSPGAGQCAGQQQGLAGTCSPVVWEVRALLPGLMLLGPLGPGVLPVQPKAGTSSRALPQCSPSPARAGSACAPSSAPAPAARTTVLPPHCRIRPSPLTLVPPPHCPLGALQGHWHRTQVLAPLCQRHRWPRGLPACPGSAGSGGAGSTPGQHASEDSVQTPR